MHNTSPQYGRHSYNRQISLWLLFCAGVIFSMILLGGVTRLTNSGLSMVEWKPLMGIIPPITDTEWQETFAKYQQFPEYQKVNHGMTVGEFKSIFMFEYLHRVLGRLIGIIFLLPFLFFYFTKRIPPGLTAKLMVMFVLGGLQGLLGWYMVKSGLVDNPRVSPYRLTAHLGAAVIIYGYILWVAFGLLSVRSAFNSTRNSVTKGLKRFSFTLTGLIFLMILSGGLVAGSRAGFAYPTFPLMGDSFIPAGLFNTDPTWLAIFEDITTIQFNHRIFAYLLFVLILSFSFKVLRSGVSGKLRTGTHCLVVLLLIQVTLGISTLLLHVPVALAAAHQGGAIALFTASLLVSRGFSHNSTTRL
ncbi:MAG: cytochrome c oxidase assembly protein subunit 15 [Porticoccus sp.]|jgi:cytochrome c oxidase assembly protein subunit 15